jgi:acyl-coenzyme A thioesterase PaaI-like protein
LAEPAFQDRIPDNHCFGCGPDNEKGLRIKSRWAGPDTSLCVYDPEPHQMAGPTHVLNGGIIATVVDCHCVCTAIADAYRREGREPGDAPDIWYATGTLSVRYEKPASITEPLELHATVVEAGPKRTRLTCVVHSGGNECASAEVIAIRVPPEWRDARHGAPPQPDANVTDDESQSNRGM